MLIINAKNKTLSQMNSNLPNMSDTIKSWFQNITFGIPTRVNVGADWQETITEIKTKGVVQPARDEDLAVLEEGMRFWEWQMIHCLPDLDLKNNQYIYYKDVKYKVMHRKNFTEYGYIRYMILEAFFADKMGV